MGVPQVLQYLVMVKWLGWFRVSLVQETTLGDCWWVDIVGLRTPAMLQEFRWWFLVCGCWCCCCCCCCCWCCCCWCVSRAGPHKPSYWLCFANFWRPSGHNTSNTAVFGVTMRFASGGKRHGILNVFRQNNTKNSPNNEIAWFKGCHPCLQCGLVSWGSDVWTAFWWMFEVWMVQPWFTVFGCRLRMAMVECSAQHQWVSRFFLLCWAGKCNIPRVFLFTNNTKRYPSPNLRKIMQFQWYFDGQEGILCSILLHFRH